MFLEHFVVGVGGETTDKDPTAGYARDCVVIIVHVLIVFFVICYGERETA